MGAGRVRDERMRRDGMVQVAYAHGDRENFSMNDNTSITSNQRVLVCIGLLFDRVETMWRLWGWSSRGSKRVYVQNMRKEFLRSCSKRVDTFNEVPGEGPSLTYGQGQE
jgi:hypothetical protein